MNHAVRTLRAALLAFLVLLIPWARASAGPDPQPRWVTLSGRGVILSGGSFVDLNLSVPACAAPKEFLVLGVYVAPEVVVGATSIDVVNLQRWAVSVPVYQRFTGATIQVPLTVVGQGPEHLAATLPAGQSIAGTAGSVFVRVTLLGGTPASHRFEFNVHVTGACGVASIMPAG